MSGVSMEDGGTSDWFTRITSASITKWNTTWMPGRFA